MMQCVQLLLQQGQTADCFIQSHISVSFIIFYYFNRIFGGFNPLVFMVLPKPPVLQLPAAFTPPHEKAQYNNQQTGSD
jgi:hypothetical protein